MSGETEIPLPPVPADGEWHTVAIQRSNRVVRYFVDDKETDSDGKELEK